LLGKKASWKAEYEDSLYKIYDSNGSLAGYFFPHYGDIEPKEDEDEAIEELNKTHAQMSEATLLLPMVKLGVFDKEKGMDIEYVLASLQANSDRVEAWKKWLDNNAKAFRIFVAKAHTAREDRNMLSIALGIAQGFSLGEREVAMLLVPLLDKLQQDGLL
jgi:hypothetical protein